jgi:predicted metalloprotease
MRWEGGRESDNIEDRRGQGGGGGGGFGLPIPIGGGLGIGGMIIVGLISLVFGIDPTMLLQGGNRTPSPAPYESQQQRRPPVNDEMRRFVSLVLADTEDTWRGVFGQMNQRYQEPRLVLFSGSVNSACGFAQAAVGPFYCPADRKVYLDLSFFRDLSARFRAPGDFAQAYVIAHEVGHHVQTLLGISDRVRAVQARGSKAEGNALSVRMELQADCFAGMWAHHAQRVRQRLEPGDLEEALAAATAIGDDRLQKQARGYVVPESFTHGSSAQRVRWFQRGYEGGRMSDCDTFNARAL